MPELEISSILSLPQVGPTQCRCQKEQFKRLRYVRLIFDTATQNIILEDHKPERILPPAHYIT
jgi:hypothetical protein